MRFPSLLLTSLFLPVSLAFASDAPEPAPQFWIERQPVPGGAELLTAFGWIPDVKQTGDPGSPGAAIPLISVLRDTLGDSNPENDRLRYVWVLTTSTPTLLQRAAAAIPFYYWGAGVGKSGDRRPKPVLDMGSPAKHVWSSLTGTVVQLMALDPRGALLRAPTRSYRNNVRDQRQLHLLEGLAVLSRLEGSPDAKEQLTEPELFALQARLSLACQMFGGLVSDSKLLEAYIKQRTKTMEERGHNWELLRQRAEANGLYFEPLGLDGAKTQALLWVAKEDLTSGEPHSFDGRFLSISDPYRDPKLRDWTGYTELRYLESEGRTVELIPLGLYSLDHPKVPLLVVDFRDTHGPRRREMARHAIVDTVSGVIGYSQYGNWPYMIGATMWNFVQTRHGVANSRSSRIRAYAQVRQWLTLDPALPPQLRAELQRRLELLGVNPLQDNALKEAEFAQKQYAQLQRYAHDPQGLASKLEHTRSAETVAYDHGFGARLGLQLAHYGTLGLYTHREESGILLHTRLDAARRARGSGRIVTISQEDAP
jgi:hypothetical protein